MPKSALARLLRPRARAASLLAVAAIAVAPGLALSADQAAPVRLAQAATPAAPAAGSPFTADQKKAIEGIIKDYLINNPEVMLDIQNALEARMEKIQADRAKIAIEQNAKDIFHRALTPVAGNPKGDITVVEFFDYNCGYCRRAYPSIAKLIEKDAKVRVVLKEFPILSKGSEEASRVALAAAKQNKYWEVHRALIAARGQVDGAAALRIAEKLGLDMTRLKADMTSADVTAEIASVREIAHKMGIQGTPHFLVGDRSISGAPQNLLDVMATHVTELRKSGCKVC